MNLWKGRWLIVVSIIHTVVGIVLFPEVLLSIIRRRVFDTVGTDPMTGAVVWFFLFGIVLFISGLSIYELEKSLNGWVPKSIGWSLLVLVILGVILMPVSGFWLALPTAIAILIGKPNTLTA